LNLTADTNVLLRAASSDHDEPQVVEARRIMAEAVLIAVPVPVLCEFVWVLRNGRKLDREQIAHSIRQLMASSRVAANRPAVDAGLAAMAAGGDFADGAIAYEGSQLGGETFVTFDRKAARLLARMGMPTELLSA
jgi:predicted nucleic-acid-binding protein